jgi:hypothetical protein
MELERLIIEADHGTMSALMSDLTDLKSVMQDGELKLHLVPDPKMLEKIFVISTEHITEEDSKALNKRTEGIVANSELAVNKYDIYGWIVILPESLTLAKGDADDSLFPFSDSFWAILRYVKDNYPKCTRVQFDCDGLSHDEFPVYEW